MIIVSFEPSQRLQTPTSVRSTVTSTKSFWFLSNLRKVHQDRLLQDAANSGLFLEFNGYCMINIKQIYFYCPCREIFLGRQPSPTKINYNIISRHKERKSNNKNNSSQNRFLQHTVKNICMIGQKVFLSFLKMCVALEHWFADPMCPMFGSGSRSLCMSFHDQGWACLKAFLPLKSLSLRLCWTCWCNVPQTCGKVPRARVSLSWKSNTERSAGSRHILPCGSESSRTSCSKSTCTWFLQHTTSPHN